jgi:hypothetical protein
MHTIFERIRQAFTEPVATCGSCGRELAGVKPFAALAVPNLYCSGDCAEDGKTATNK